MRSPRMTSGSIRRRRPRSRWAWRGASGFKLGPDQPGGSRKVAMVFVPTRVLARQIVNRGLALIRRKPTLAGPGDE